MTTVPIAEAMKIGWVYHETTFAELSTTGIHTLIRTEDEYPDLFAWANDFVVDVFTPLMPACVLDRIVLSVWATGGGFTGWHQIAAQDSALAFGGGDPLPYQCSWCWGYRNTSEPLIAAGRRRNRSYIGPIKKSLVQPDSRMSDGFRTSMSTALELKHDELRAIGPTLFPEELRGFAVASAAEGVLMDTNLIVTSLRFDTIRSRADKTPEQPLFTPTFPD